MRATAATTTTKKTLVSRTGEKLNYSAQHLFVRFNETVWAHNDPTIRSANATVCIGGIEIATEHYARRRVQRTDVTFTWNRYEAHRTKRLNERFAFVWVSARRVRSWNGWTHFWVKIRIESMLFHRVVGGDANSQRLILSMPLHSFCVTLNFMVRLLRLHECLAKCACALLAHSMRN